MTENEIRQRVVDAAMSHMGAVRGNAEHHKILDIYNSHKPLPRGYKMVDRDAWCAATASAIAIETGNDDIVPIECSCSRMIAQAKEMGIWVEADNHVPKPADLMLYDWDDDGHGEDTGAPEHIGTVVRVGGGEITVFEGNMRGSRAGTRRVRIDGRYIRGFICPDYASKATVAPRPTSYTVHKVQKGEYLSMLAQRYYGDYKRWPEIQKANGIDGTVIHPNQELRIPGTRIHRVKRGEYLSLIAQTELGDYRRWPEIQRMNCIDGTVIHPDDELVIPE